MKQVDVKTPPSERPTDEAFMQGEFQEEPISAVAGAKTRHRRLDSCEIDRLFLKGALTKDHHTTLENFTKDLHEAGMVFCPRSGITPSGTSGQGQFIADNAFRRVKRVTHQIELLRSIMDGPSRMIVLSALTDDRKIKPVHESLMQAAADVLSQVYDPRSRSERQRR